jgi:hypothetical protein
MSGCPGSTWLCAQTAHVVAQTATPATVPTCRSLSAWQACNRGTFEHTKTHTSSSTVAVRVKLYSEVTPLPPHSRVSPQPQRHTPALAENNLSASPRRTPSCRVLPAPARPWGLISCPAPTHRGHAPVASGAAQFVWHAPVRCTWCCWCQHQPKCSPFSPMTALTAGGSHPRHPQVTIIQPRVLLYCREDSGVLRPPVRCLAFSPVCFQPDAPAACSRSMRVLQSDGIWSEWNLWCSCPSWQGRDREVGKRRGSLGVSLGGFC